MRTSTRLAVPFFYALLMGTCNTGDNYPEGSAPPEKKLLEPPHNTDHKEEASTKK